MDGRHSSGKKGMKKKFKKNGENDWLISVSSSYWKGSVVPHDPPVISILSTDSIKA